MTSMQMKTERRPRVALVTLGCDKNTVDNEYLAAMMEGAGLEVVVESDGRGLDAAVITTCGFIAVAREQSIQAIVQLAAAKRETGSPRRLYVAGCLSQKHGGELMEQIPEIDGLVGVGQMRRLTEVIKGDLEAEEQKAGPPEPAADTEIGGNANGKNGARKSNGAARVMEIAPKPTVDIYQHFARRAIEPGPSAFLKVSDGCNHTCSFCAIPLMKGKLRSVEPEIVLAEARDLLARGVREINLVAQDLSEYGRDRLGEWGREYKLPQLLRDLCALPGEFWVRCLYYYPGNVTDEFLRVMAEEPKVVPYLEMPLQHLHPDVLRRMKRPFHTVNTFDTVERIRAAVPGIALRSTFILGFPGETRQEFQYLLKGMARLRFDRLGAFEYSHEPDTPSGAMKKQVDPREKAKRWRTVMERQLAISEKLQAERVGKVERVLIESFDEEEECWVGRSTRDAPNVDGRVHVYGGSDLESGQFVDVAITEATEYDVAGELCLERFTQSL